MSDYFDIEDLVAENQMVDCTANMDLGALGYLGGRKEGDLVKKGDTIKMPFWLATASSETGAMTLNLPRAYRTKVVNSLSASSVDVPIHSFYPFYYRLGMWICNILSNQEIPRLLLDSFRHRMGMIIDYTQCRGDGKGSSNGSSFWSVEEKEDPESMYHLLDENERKIYAAGVQQAGEQKSWQRHERERLSTEASRSLSFSMDTTRLEVKMEL
ncbi:MAG: hypothetical protein DHS80DRAFT_29249 [Piptocephalis tieghemiana]|nr:MAG: hypothetical protein DHS80DRAFT_29249 [Piptocephalis tieghemiana]